MCAGSIPATLANPQVKAYVKLMEIIMLIVVCLALAGLFAVVEATEGSIREWLKRKRSG